MKAQLAILLTLVIWGTIPIIDKLGLSERKVSLPLGLALRVLAGVIVLLPMVCSREDLRRQVATASWKLLGLFFISGLLSLVVSQYTYYLALQEEQASRLFPLLFGGAPVVTMLLGALVLKETLPPYALAGGCLIGIGSGLLLIR